MLCLRVSRNLTQLYQNQLIKIIGIKKQKHQEHSILSTNLLQDINSTYL